MKIRFLWQRKKNVCFKGCWKKKEYKIKSIGIAGSIRGSGVTHLSVALANYAASGLGEKTACLELNGHGELSHWKECNCNGYFSDFGVHYYPEFKKEQIPVFMTRNYQKVIMDFGDAYWKFREELLRCDGKIFLLNINPWQEFAIKKMLHTMADESWGSIEAVYCSRTMQKSEKRKIEKTLKNNKYRYMYNWNTLLYTWNWHSIVSEIQ